MILPVGLDETRLSRLPWVSIAILVLNVAAFVATSGAEDDLEPKLQEVVGYWLEHPYLEMPAEMEQRFGLTREALVWAAGRRAGSAPAARAPPDAGAEQARLDALCEEVVEVFERLPVRRWSLVPSRGAAQPGWVTYQFLHAGLGHLLGNMLVFLLVVAPFLEEAWGRRFFLAFYLVGGVVAGIAQALPMRDSATAILGASGAVSACLGAFALRFAHRRVRIFYWFFIVVRGTFFVPVWLYAFFGLAMDLLGLKLAGSAGGVAYASHVGGFMFGLAVAVAVRASGLDERLAPEGAARWGRTLSASRAEDALAAGRTGDARAHLERAIADDPGDEASALSLARVHAAAFERERTTHLVERLLSARLARGDEAGARAVMAEMEAVVDPEAFRPAIAYRAASLVSDAALSERLDAVAARGGGALAAKALLRSAERARASDPDRARALAQAARAAEGASAEITARAEAVERACPPTGVAPGAESLHPAVLPAQLELPPEDGGPATDPEMAAAAPLDAGAPPPLPPPRRRCAGARPRHRGGEARDPAGPRGGGGGGRGDRR